jgi:hypothetical protein
MNAGRRGVGAGRGIAVDAAGAAEARRPAGLALTLTLTGLSLSGLGQRGSAVVSIARRAVGAGFAAADLEGRSVIDGHRCRTDSAKAGQRGARVHRDTGCAGDRAVDSQRAAVDSGRAGVDAVPARTRVPVGSRDAPALAGALAAEQRRCYAHHAKRGRVMIDDDGADRRRRAVRAPRTGRQPRHRLKQQVLPGTARIRSRRSEARRRRIDEARIIGKQPFGIETQAHHRAGAEVLHDDIGPGNQPFHQRLALGALHIDGEAALVAACREMIGALAVDEMARDRPVALKGAIQRLDADDVGAHVAEKLRRRGAGQEVVEAEDLDPVGGVIWFSSLPSPVRRPSAR